MHIIMTYWLFAVLCICLSTKITGHLKNGATFKLIKGNEERKDIDEVSFSSFHNCGLKSACQYVVKIIGTSNHYLIEQERDLQNIKGNLIIWKKIIEELPQAKTCKMLQQRGVKSGLHNITLPSGVHQVFCDMETNGGGYTFISNETLSKITQTDVEVLLSDNSTVLMRLLKPDGSQQFTIIEQYTDTNGISVQLNNYNGYSKPKNSESGKYLYIGTLPLSYAAKGNIQGFYSNGISINFTNCDGLPNSYFAFYAKPPNTASHSLTGPVCDKWRESARNSSPGSELPRQFFMFTEMHYGGCGCYGESPSWHAAVSPVIATAIGLR